MASLWKKCISAYTEAETQTPKKLKIQSSLHFGPVKFFPKRIFSPKGIFSKDWMGKYAVYACLVFCKWSDGSCFSNPDQSHLIYMTTTYSPIVLEGTPLPIRHLLANRLGMVGSLVHKMRVSLMSCVDVFCTTVDAG
jgi:hypothetical protein